MMPMSVDWRPLSIGVIYRSIGVQKHFDGNSILFSLQILSNSKVEPKDIFQKMEKLLKNIFTQINPTWD